MQAEHAEYNSVAGLKRSAEQPHATGARLVDRVADRREGESLERILANGAKVSRLQLVQQVREAVRLLHDT
jgi:hypothetical protein